jgi:O-antigen/teichoic acid export membrane protein
MSIKRQVAVGLKWQAINIAGRQLLFLLVFTTLARLLDPTAFGLVGLVGVYLSFVALIVDQGLGTAIIQRQDLEPEHLDTAFWFILGCAGLVSAATIAFARPLSVLLGEPKLTSLLGWSSLSLVFFAASAVHNSLLTKEMDFRRPAIRTFIANSIGGLAGVVLVLAGTGAWALVWQQIVSAAAGAVFLWRVSNYRPSFRFSFRHLRELLGIGSSVFSTTVLWFFSTRLDQMVIGRFAGAPALGLYMIGGKLPDLARFVTQQPISEVSLPALSKLQHDHPRMCEAIYRGMELHAVISFASFIGLASVASDLVPFLFGQKWQSAASLCALLAVYGLVNTLQVFFHPSLVASGGAGKYVLLNVWHTLGVAGACFAGIRFGMNYLVLGLIINGVVIAIPALLFLRSRIGLSPLKYCRPCLAPAFAAILMAAAVWGLGHFGPATLPLVLKLALKILSGAIVYIGCLLLLDRAALLKIVEIGGHALHRGESTATTPASAVT